MMVETYLALWVLLVYGLTALYLIAPSRKKAAALGLVVGLALLTKLTIALFLPGPLIFGCVQALRGGARPLAVSQEARALHRGLSGGGRPVVLQERAPGRAICDLFVEVQRDGDRPRSCTAVAASWRRWPAIWRAGR